MVFTRGSRRSVALLTSGLLAAGLLTSGSLVSSADAASSKPKITKVSATGGGTAGKTRITVTGSNFTHVTTVKFGTTKGTSVHVISSKKLTVLTPKHGAGTVDVRVTTRAGTSAKSSHDHFSFWGAPTVTKVSPSSAPTSGGTKITLTGTGFSSVKAVLFGGVKGTSIKVTKSTSLTVVTPQMSVGSMDIIVQTAYGYSHANSHDRFSFTEQSDTSTPPPSSTSPTPTPSPSQSAPTTNILSVVVPQYVFAVGIALDSAGDIFYSDNGNGLVYKRTPDGTTTIFAGTSAGTGAPTNGAATSSQLVWPQALATDASNNLYIADDYDVEKVTPGGTLSILASGQDVNAVAATANGTVYFAGINDHEVFKFSGGTKTPFFALADPKALTTDPSGNVYAADGTTVWKVTPGGTSTQLATGLDSVVSLAANSAGDVYVGEGGSANRIVKISADNATVTTVVGPGPSGSGVQSPGGLAFDTAGTTLYIADSNNNDIEKLTNLS